MGIKFTKMLIDTTKPSKSGYWYSTSVLEDMINNPRVQAIFSFNVNHAIGIEKYDKDKLEVKNEYDIDGMRKCALLTKLYIQDKKLYGDFETIISKHGEELENFIKTNGVDKVKFVLKGINFKQINNIVQSLDFINFQWKEI